MQKSELLNFTIETAKKAGDILMTFFQKEYKISYKEKNERNIVTEADKASELFIINKIKTQYPTHDILAEESGAHNIENADYRWIIDPLDGTNNFSHTHPFFAVSIGLEYKKEIILGVVYAPIFQELFYAEKSKGAFLNNKQIKVSKRQTLKKSLTSTGFPPSERQQNLPYFLHMLDKTQGLRRCGAAAIDLCYIAAGRLDGFWEFGLSPWDIAAAKIIIEEAGGKVTNLNGSTLDLEGKTILATNKTIHEEMRKELSQIKE